MSKNSKLSTPWRSNDSSVPFQEILIKQVEKVQNILPKEYGGFACISLMPMFFSALSKEYPSASNYAMAHASRLAFGITVEVPNYIESWANKENPIDKAIDAGSNLFKGHLKNPKDTAQIVTKAIEECQERFTKNNPKTIKLTIDLFNQNRELTEFHYEQLYKVFDNELKILQNKQMKSGSDRAR